MRADLSLKAMAQGMGISSAHLSALEYGEKRLSEKHVDAALAFFSDKATPQQRQDLRIAAQQSRDIVNMDDFDPQARGLVAAFARRISSGTTPPPELLKWIKEQPQED
jgi:transcriptional regulator with XRE-family HTH domain